MVRSWTEATEFSSVYNNTRICKFSFCACREEGTKEPSYWNEAGKKPLAPLTLGRMVDLAAELWGDKEAFLSLYQGHRFSYREVRDKVTDDIQAECVTMLRTISAKSILALHTSSISRIHSHMRLSNCKPLLLLLPSNTN
jgi:hypothetical protein